MPKKSNYEWISVSEFARRIGKTTQTVYNMLKTGDFETLEFNRGTKMRGILIKVKKDNQ